MYLQKLFGKRRKLVWVSMGLIVAIVSSAAVVIEEQVKISPIDETKQYISKTVETDCNFELPTKIEANSLRLLGTSCRLESLTNKTNGYTASLFIAGSEKKWSTDFIHMSEGLNELRLEYFDSKGQLHERNIKVEGRSPASINEEPAI